MKVSKKIAVFSNHLFSYSETFIMSQGEGLNKYEPIYIGSDLIKDGINPPVDRMILINDGMFGQIKDKLFKIGLPLPGLIKKLKKYNFKLIHAHFGPNGYSSLPLSEKMNIPLIVTFHGFDLIDKPTREKNGRLHMNYFRHFDLLSEKSCLFIAVSDFIRNKLIKLGVDDRKVIRCYIGIDVDKFCPDTRVKKKNIILCVGRMSKYKGQEYLIRAMEILKIKYPNYELVFVGDGEEKHKLETLARIKKLNVRFTGKQSPRQVIDWMRQAKVYVQPSVRLDNGQEEALGLTIAEAQSVGVPAIVFKSGGMVEAINPNRSGFAIEPENIEELSEAIDKLISDDVLWNEFSKNAREFVLTDHNLHKQCKELEAIYDEIIEI